MGRKSLAEKYFEETPEQEEEGNWIVLYDFKGMKPSSKYWHNLKRLTSLVGESSLIQYSVFMTKDKRGAITATKLAKHYGTETRTFKAEELVLN